MKYHLNNCRWRERGRICGRVVAKGPIACDCTYKYIKNITLDKMIKTNSIYYGDPFKKPKKNKKKNMGNTK